MNKLPLDAERRVRELNAHDHPVHKFFNQYSDMHIVLSKYTSFSIIVMTFALVDGFISLQKFLPLIIEGTIEHYFFFVTVNKIWMHSFASRVVARL